jgi:cytochrome c55X
MRSRLLPWATLWVAVAVSGQAAEPTPERKRALIELVQQDCGSCHGLTLRGGLGPSLRPEALAGKDLDALVAIVLDGVPGQPMPPWRPELSEEEARWLITQLLRGLP